MKCQFCEQQHPSYNLYCTNSGKLMDASAMNAYTYNTLEFCVNCGEKNGDSHSNCVKCGANLLKFTEKKVGFSKKFAQNISAIPLSGDKITKHIPLNTEQIKQASQENINYIKKNRFIFIPILISIVLMLALAFLMKDTMMDKVNDFADDADINELTLLLNSEEFIKDFEREYDIRTKIDVPNFPYVSNLIMLAHNANFNVNLEGDMSAGYWGDDFEFSGKVKNLGYVFTFISFITLSLGAVIFGFMMRKEQWNFVRGVAYSTIVYTIFIGIMSLIARYKLEIGIDESDYVTLDFLGEITPTIISPMLFAALASAISFSVVGFVVYHGKNTITAFKQLTSYIQYAVYSLGITVIGLLLHIVNMMITLRSDDMSNRLDDNFNFFVDNSTNFILSIYFSVVNWNANLFGSWNLNADLDFEINSIAYKWFFNGSGSDTREIRNFVSESLVLHPVFFVVLVLAIIGGVGYLSFSMHKLNLKDIGIFAAMFAFIQIVLIYFTNIKIEIEADDFYLITLTYNYITTFIYSFIIAFAGLYAGGYIQKYVKK